MILSELENPEQNPFDKMLSRYKLSMQQLKDYLGIAQNKHQKNWLFQRFLKNDYSVESIDDLQKIFQNNPRITERNIADLLYVNGVVRKSQKINKSGIIPFFKKSGKVFVLLMIPSDPDFGGDMAQIAKGRMDGDISPVDNALKEGHEELGLKKSNIKHMMFLDSTDMHVYACEVKNQMDFDKPHYETGETKWVDVKDQMQIRASHRHFIKKLLEKI